MAGIDGPLSLDSVIRLNDDAVLSDIQDIAEYIYILCSEAAADLFNASPCTALQSYTKNQHEAARS